MGDEKDFNSVLGVYTERQEHQGKEIDNLKVEVSKLKDAMQDIKLQQIKDNEKIVTLFGVFNEIKDSIKEINEKIDNKKDTFKEATFRFAIEMTKYGIMGGLGYYLLSMKN